MQIPIANHLNCYFVNKYSFRKHTHGKHFEEGTSVFPLVLFWSGVEWRLWWVVDCRLGTCSDTIIQKIERLETYRSLRSSGNLWTSASKASTALTESTLSLQLRKMILGNVRRWHCPDLGWLEDEELIWACQHYYKNWRREDPDKHLVKA